MNKTLIDFGGIVALFLQQYWQNHNVTFLNKNQILINTQNKNPDRGDMIIAGGLSHRISE